MTEAGQAPWATCGPLDGSAASDMEGRGDAPALWLTDLAELFDADGGR
jgi:hypothetical protein